MVDNKIKNLLDFQEDLGNKEIYFEINKIFIDRCQNILKEILKRKNVDDWLKELVNQHYEEFIEVWNLVFEEKSGNVSLGEVKARLPGNNIFLKIIEENKRSEDKDGLDKAIEDELRKAKSENRVN